jgi:hypothetical protein
MNPDTTAMAAMADRIDAIVVFIFVTCLLFLIVVIPFSVTFLCTLVLSLAHFPIEVTIRR